MKKCLIQHNVPCCTQIQLLGNIDLRMLLNTCGLEHGHICHYTVGNDRKIHMLVTTREPSRNPEQLTCEKSNVQYAAITLDVDWNTGDVWHHTITDFGSLSHDWYALQRLYDGFLLISPFVQRGASKHDQHTALQTDSCGKIIQSYNFGNGITRCVVDGKNRILTSYCDQGILTDPISASGVNMWSADGSLMWRNQQHAIFDCYAMNIDDEDNVWFYYHPTFSLVKTDYVHESVFEPNVTGCCAFLFHKQQSDLLFDNGYQCHDQFHINMCCSKTALPRKQNTAVFWWNGQNITPVSYTFRSSLALLSDAANQLYFTEWRNDTTANT